MPDPEDTPERQAEKREHEERTTGPGDDSEVDQTPGEEGVAGSVPGSLANKPTG